MSNVTLPPIASVTVRQAEHPVNPLFIERWSPRAYTGEEIPDAVLFTAFEAARWAPSGGNEQPWRFLYSKKGSATWQTFFDVLLPGNQTWAANASAIVFLVSKRFRVGRDGKLGPATSNSFDTGAAWQNFALQAHALGWGTRAIGGYDRDKARVALRVPEEFALEFAVAVGKPGDRSLLPPDQQAREVPNGRHPLQSLVIEGVWPAAV